MICMGRAWKFGKDINTDAILPTRYMNLRDPLELAKHCLENENSQFAAGAKAGDIIVADKNFGCGSSREHAPLSIKGKGIACVIARSFARIFYRSAFNIGLPILECGAVLDGIEEGHELEVDLVTGVITNRSTRESFRATPIPSFMQEIIEDGGLLPHIVKKYQRPS